MKTITKTKKKKNFKIIYQTQKQKKPKENYKKKRNQRSKINRRIIFSLSLSLFDMLHKEPDDDVLMALLNTTSMQTLAQRDHDKNVSVFVRGMY